MCRIWGLTSGLISRRAGARDAGCRDRVRRADCPIVGFAQFPCARLNQCQSSEPSVGRAARQPQTVARLLCSLSLSHESQLWIGEWQCAECGSVGERKTLHMNRRMSESAEQRSLKCVCIMWTTCSSFQSAEQLAAHCSSALTIAVIFLIDILYCMAVKRQTRLARALDCSDCPFIQTQNSAYLGAYSFLTSRINAQKFLGLLNALLLERKLDNSPCWWLDWVR